MNDKRYYELRKAYGQIYGDIDDAIKKIGIWIKPITDSLYKSLDDEIKKINNYPYSLMHHTYKTNPVPPTHSVLNDVIHWYEPFINEIIINAVLLRIDPLIGRIGYLDDPVNKAKHEFHIDFTHDVKIYNDVLQWGMVNGVPYLMDQFGRRYNKYTSEWWNDHE